MSIAPVVFVVGDSAPCDAAEAWFRERSIPVTHRHATDAPNDAVSRVDVLVVDARDEGARDLCARLRRVPTFTSAWLLALDTPSSEADAMIVDGVVDDAACEGENITLRLAVAVHRAASRSKERENDGRLRLADRMATLGMLSAGIGHEINNPLAYVMMNIDLARERVRHGIEPEEIDPLLAAAAEGTDRMRVILADLRSFARPDRARAPRLIDVHAMLEASIRIVRNTLRHHARLEKSLATVPPVRAGEGQLGQVFVNLLMNAAHAVEDAARDDALVEVTCDADDERVRVTIRDNGVGIDEATLPFLFEPFFTTKGPTRETGLGLAICHRIIVELGGTIDIESTLGTGTSVLVDLPIGRASVPAMPRVPTKKHVGGEPSTERRRVLVIDDDADVTRALARAFAHHDVVVAFSAKEAIALLDRVGAFDAIVCDLMMPDELGFAVLDHVRASDPLLADRFALVTGGALSATARDLIDGFDGLVLEKPFSLRQARGLLDALLDGAPLS